MRILIINRSPWDEKLPNGNTLSNLFSNWENTEFANIYSRSAKPANECCSRYYSISPVNVASHILTPWKIGSEFVFTPKSVSKNFQKEESLGQISRKYQSLSFWSIEFIYKFGHWNNTKLRDFIKKFSPDVVFCFGYPDPITPKILQYIKRECHAVIVSYFVDDHYKLHSALSLRRMVVRKRLKNITSLSDKCYAISKMMCEEYSCLFGKDFSLLFKGCEISEPKVSFNNPIRFVYAGNLLYNRNKSLEALARAIEVVNAGTSKAFLDIYSGTKVSDDVRNSLNIEGASCLNDPKPFSEIKEIMHSSDIVLHVESFDKEQMDVVRLSFSTKITDCMQSGSVMMAIGPAGIASIEYPKNSIPGAIVVNSLDELPNVVRSIVDNPEQLISRAEEMNQFAKEAAEISKVRNRLRTDFVELLNTKK